MKAIAFRVLFIAVCIVLFLFVFLSIEAASAESIYKQKIDLFKNLNSYKSYSFNISDLLVDPNDPSIFDSNNQSHYFYSGSDPEFCQKLRNCIEMNIKGGTPCVLSYKVKSGVLFSLSDISASISNCPTSGPSADVKEELYSDTKRKICKFKPISKVNKFREDNLSIIDYEPYIHNCYVPDVLGTQNILDDNNSINYLYSGRGTSVGYNFTNGGTVRILVTNVSIDNNPDATCSYSLYVCGQNAIAAKEYETPVNVFKNVQNLDDRELYFDESIFWHGTPPIGYASVADLYSWWKIDHDDSILPADANIYGYYPRYYEFNFNGTFKNKEALIDAIDAGMWEWNKANYNNKAKMKYFSDEFINQNYIYFSYYPIDQGHIKEDVSLGSDCWVSDYQSSNILDRTYVDTASSSPTWTEYESLKHNFIFNDISSFNSLIDGERIRMTLGLKKIFISDKKFTVTQTSWYNPIVLWPFPWVTSINIKGLVYYTNPRLDTRTILVMDPVTFCD